MGSSLSSRPVSAKPQSFAQTMGPPTPMSGIKRGGEPLKRGGEPKPIRGTTVRRSKDPNPPVAQRYVEFQKHPELFDTETGWRDEWFDPHFLAAVRENTDEAWNSIITEHLPGAVFSCKMMSDKFCEMLIEEVDNFTATGLPARRPNSMNNYGIILNEIGWRPMVDILQDHVLAKISARWWKHIAPFDDHHTFIVRYKEGEDLGLDMHTDDSDVTFNLCLGKEFTGAGLCFCGVMGATDHRKLQHIYRHEVGTVCFHLGRQRHGADDIQSGERLNLIIWNHSSKYRNSSEYNNPSYYKEEGPPDALCLSYTHDRDYGVYKDYSAKNNDFQGRGWCPRRGFEYDGFQPEKGGRSAGGGCRH